MKYAEEFNYWLTTVHPSKSQGEVSALLEDFGIESIQVSQGNANGKYAWMIRFHWGEKPYRFLFTPMVCRQPNRIYSFGGKRRSGTEQAKFQMGRIAVHFIKAILTAAEVQPDALFGFLELPAYTDAETGIPITAAEIDLNKIKALPSGDVIDAEYKTHGV